MILQPASRKEVKRIAIGTLIGDGILVAGLFLLSQFDIGTFPLVKILCSAAVGSLIAIANFAIMCITVQSAVGMTDKKKMQAKFQISYNARMIIQSGWVVAAFLLKPIHFIAGAAPILFPKLTILYLNITGKLMPAESLREADSGETDEA
jgi:dipeptide/tripeptide permease